MNGPPLLVCDAFSLSLAGDYAMPAHAPPPALWISILACLPFVLLLGTIALAPLLEKTKHAWHKNRTQWLVAGTLGLLGAGAHLLLRHEAHSLLHALAEYLAFVSVLAALYAASGGIHITGAIAGYPTTNALLLAVGAVLASLIGTTGASMLLIRPLLRANADRKHKTHIFVFFIFIVSNCGGLLTPMGDPPLFIGFLRGVPFFWTSAHLLKPWLLTNGLLLALFGALDTRIFLREAMITRGRMLKAVAKVEHRLHVRGWQNVGLLLLVPAIMVLCGNWLQPALAPRLGEANAGMLSQVIQAVLFAGIAALSVKTATAALGHEARFSWHPIQEVGALFLGIFLAMVPAMALLHDVAADLPLSAPWHYFFATGSLSAILDNAPTYAAFGELACAKMNLAGWSDLALHAPRLLAGISCGAVFCGALTYIGNGPNFMVKSVCESHHVKMPSFFGYLLWSNLFLGPVLLVVAWVFFGA